MYISGLHLTCCSPTYCIVSSMKLRKFYAPVIYFVPISGHILVLGVSVCWGQIDGAATTTGDDLSTVLNQTTVAPPSPHSTSELPADGDQGNSVEPLPTEGVTEGSATGGEDAGNGQEESTTSSAVTSADQLGGGDTAGGHASPVPTLPYVEPEIDQEENHSTSQVLLSPTTMPQDPSTAATEGSESPTEEMGTTVEETEPPTEGDTGPSAGDTESSTGDADHPAEETGSSAGAAGPTLSSSASSSDISSTAQASQPPPESTPAAPSTTIPPTSTTSVPTSTVGSSEDRVSNDDSSGGSTISEMGDTDASKQATTALPQQNVEGSDTQATSTAPPARASNTTTVPSEETNTTESTIIDADDTGTSTSTKEDQTVVPAGEGSGVCFGEAEVSHEILYTLYYSIL